MTQVTLPIFGIDRHRMTIDGEGVTTLVGGFGCPLKCKYCLNPHAWNPDTYKRCRIYTPEQLYNEVKIDDLYFRATGGGVTFGGGESLLHAAFIKEFKNYCPDWSIAVETSLNVPKESLLLVLDAVDEFIVDIKDMDPEIYLSYTGMTNERVLENLRILAENTAVKRIKIRVPSIPAVNTAANINSSLAQLKALGFQDLETFEYVLR